MAGRRSVARRIDIDLDDILKEMAKKNDTSVRQASKELGKVIRVELKGSKVKITREIKF